MYTPPSLKQMSVSFSFKDYKSCELSAVFTCEAVEGGGDEKVLVMRRMEEDDSGGIATGTQKRGSKQGEALTSACFTFERERGKRGKRSRERRTDWKSKTKAGQKGDKQQRGKSTGRKAMCKVPRPRDIRQVQFNSTATGRQQSTGSHTHEAAGCSQAAAARGHHCAAQAASDSSQVLPIIRLHPETQIPQHHWLQREKMSVRHWEMDPTDDLRTCEGILLEKLRRC